MIRIFISYSHADGQLRSELEKHLSNLKRQGVIDIWQDRRIIAGSEFNNEIDENLKQANVILLLISPDFLSSDYCNNVEVRTALKMHENKQAQVIPVILRTCDWQNAPFGKLLATPKDGKPIKKFADIDDGFYEVVLEIKRVIDLLKLSPKENIDNNFTNNYDFTNRPRSSNLSIVKNFTDKENDDFLEDSFNYISNFFEESLKELSKRNDGITYKFEKIDSGTFTAALYKNGRKMSDCTIFKGGFINSDGISYTNGWAKTGKNSSNTAINVKDDGNIQYFEPAFGFSENKKLTQEGASEHFWKYLIEPLQRNY